MSPEQRKVLVASIRERFESQGVSPTEVDLWQSDFRKKPPSIAEFLESDYYLGAVGRGIYPVWRKEMERIFAPGSKIFEVIKAGAIGCIDQDALYVKADGTIESIRESLRSKEVDVVCPTIDGQRPSKAREVIDSGTQSTVRISLGDGTSLRVTPDHKIRTWKDGYRWVRADKLIEGDFVCVARKLEVNPEGSLDQDHAELLGYWVGDGSSDHYRARFSDGRYECCQRVASLLDSLFPSKLPTKITKDPRQNSWEVNVREAKRSGFLSWLEYHGAHLKTHEVLVPVEVTRSADVSVAAFLRGLYGCEGCVYLGSEKSPPRINLGMTSRRCIETVKLLLLRFGVRSRIYRSHSGRDNEKPIFTLTVGGGDNIKGFLDRVGYPSSKEGECESLRAILESKASNTNIDLLPLSQKLAFDKYVRGKVSADDPIYAKAYTHREERRVSRDLWITLQEYGFPLEESFPEDIAFEVVKSVEPSGEVEVGDVVSVEDEPAWLCQGVHVHNTGKSTVAVIELLYKLCWLDHLKDPQKFFGLLPGSRIVIGLYSVYKYKAQDVVLSYVKNFMQTSPYFRERLQIAKSEGEVWMPNKIQFICGSNELHALGDNLFGVIIDEANFYSGGADKRSRDLSEEMDQARKLYTATRRRIESRFDSAGSGYPIGFLALISSSVNDNDFTEERIQATRNDPYSLVCRYALWEAKPDRYANQERFRVLKGSTTRAARILTDNEPLPEGADVIHVPVSLRPRFEEDLLQALRDIAGVSTSGVDPLIYRKEVITEAIDSSRIHPFEIMEPAIAYDDDWQLEDIFRHRDLLHVRNSSWKPKLNPGAPRYCHVDLALTNDSAGFAMGHVSGLKKLDRTNPDGSNYKVLVPTIHLDVVLRVTPPVSSEIGLDKILQFIMMLRRYNYPIVKCTYDGWQSAHSIQALRLQGIESEVFSVDKNIEPYSILRQALYERRISVYEYPQLIEELLNLERVQIRSNRSLTYKIDHPPRMRLRNGKVVKGAKDVSDAVAAVAFHCDNSEAARVLDGTPVPPTVDSSHLNAGGLSSDWLIEDHHEHIRGIF